MVRVEVRANRRLMPSRLVRAGDREGDTDVVGVEDSTRSFQMSWLGQETKIR